MIHNLRVRQHGRGREKCIEDIEPSFESNVRVANAQCCRSSCGCFGPTRMLLQRSSTFSPLLFSIGLLIIRSAPTLSQPICPGGVPCVVGKGDASFDNSEYIRTAVGCSKTVHVKFGSGQDSTSTPTVAMCERDANDNCNYKSGVILNPSKRDCCAKAFVQRSRTCIAPTMADDPNGVFQCIQMSYTVEAGYTTAHVTFFGAYGTDLVNNGS